MEDQFFGGAKLRLIGETRVPVVSAEDLVSMKILAGRPHDLDDVAAIARASGDALAIDRVRATLQLLETALDRRDLLPTLERVMADARRGAAPGS